MPLSNIEVNMVIVPAECLGHEQGEYVTLELYKPEEIIKKAVLFSGSHDLSLDVISAMMKERDVTRQAISSHTGSMAGIMAIKKGEAHVAGIHLLHEQTGTYNAPFVEQYLKGPISYESYDLIMRKAFFESEAGHLMLEIIKSEDFACKLEKLGGYKLI